MIFETNQMSRKKIILKNVSLGLLYKILNMGIVYTSIPLLLNYLEKEQYGLWVTIFSIINIVFFVDIGIGNGLKTKLTEAISLKNYDLAKKYISTAYVLIFVIAFLLLILGVFLIYSINLKNLLNTSISELELKNVSLVTLLMVVSCFVLNLYKTFYYAIQQSSKVELSLLFYQLFVLTFIVFVLNYFPRSLLVVALIYGITNFIIGVVFTIAFFRKNQQITPSLQFFSKEKIKSLMTLSLDFFFIQLCMIIIFTTDNIIISNLLGPNEVTNYDVVYKLFNVLIVLTIIVQDPFWPLYSDAYIKKDFEWIKHTLIRLNKLFIPFVFLVGILVFFAKQIIIIWIPKDLSISNKLLLFMGLFVIVRTYGIIYMNFLNGIGKIRLQLKLYVIGAVINIPLSIYFAKYLNFGSSGVILGTIVSIISMSIFLPIQSFKILRNNEYC